MKKLQVLTLFSAVTFVLMGELRAAQIQGVTINAFSSQYTSLSTSTPDRRYVTNLVGSTGLFGDVGTYTPGGAEWLSAAAPPNAQFVTFDLGAVHTVNAMKVWNFNQAGSGNWPNNVKTAYISYSTDGVNFTTNYSASGGQYFIEALGAFSAFGQTIATNMGFSARYVRINISSNYTATGITGTVGLSKVRFIDNSVPPTLLLASENYSSNQVTVQFSESVDPVTAANRTNYVIQSGAGNATILSAAIGEFNDRVVLQTTPLTNSSYSLVATNVYDLALTQPITNTTIAIQPEVIVWLKGDTGVLTDGSGNVTNWVDQSGYGHNFSTNVVVNQYSAPPTLASGVLNGLPAVSFAAGQLLSCSNDVNLALNGDMTVCVVLNKTTSAAGDVISKTGGQGNPYTGTPQHGYTNNMPAPFDYQITSAQKSSLTWGNGAGGAPPTQASSGAFVINQYYIVTAVVTGITNAAWYLNGSFNGAGILGVAPADQGTPMMLGVRSDSGNVGDAGLTFAGNLAEVVVIRGTLAPTDLVNLNNYLGNKYGITIATLTINEQPQSVTNEVGKTATFWVSAAGVPPLKYQWQTNAAGGSYSNIVGATSAIYTTPPLTSVPYNGLNYRVVVTTPVGATNSYPATLTVVSETSPPAVFSATKTGNSTNIVVNFSEAVSTATALNTANYSLNNGVSVLSASYGSASSNSVILATSTLDPNAGYYLTVQNVQDLYGNALTTATVPVLPASLSIYLRGDSGVGLDINGAVDQWLDQTTNGNNAVQYLGGLGERPTTGDTINGVPVLRFSGGSSNYLQAASSPTLAITNDLSIYAVANVFDYTAVREILGKTVGNQPASYDYYMTLNGGQFRLYRGNGVSGAVNFNASQVPSAGTPHVLAATMQGTTASHFLDGQANGSGALVSTLGDGGTPLDIGSRNDLSQFMNGDIGEVMIFSAALSGGDRTNVDNYLGAKYFPLTISQQPQPVTTNQGVVATFSVAASQGSAHLTYQWQENSTNIPGATGATYTTPILAPSDNNDTFDVVIIVPGNSTNTSSPAILTVNSAPPAVASAGEPIWSQTNIVVLFSEVVDPVTATTLGNYSLNNSAGVLTAAMGDAPNKVVLTTSALIPGTAYTLSVTNVMDPYGNTMSGAAIPTGIYPPTTALWVRADTGVSTDLGANTVNQWNDLSGNGNNLVQTAGAPYEPLLATNALNGQPVIHFTGTNETYMSANDASTLEITGDMSIFAVVNFAALSNNTNGMIVSKTAGNLPAPYDYYVWPTTIPFGRGNGSAYAFVDATARPSTGVPHLLDVVMQGTTVNHRLDGNTNGSGTLSIPMGDTGQPLYIGTRVDGVNRLTGDFSELIILGSAVSTNDLVSLENYLIAQHRLAIGTNSYPTITQQPVASTNLDQNSTLMVAAAATGNPALAYQWYDTNNVAVTGQTNATLVISNIQASDSYYLNVTNLFGAVNSAAVAVTVNSGAPQVSLAPTNLMVYTGMPFTYTVAVVGTLPLYYQWYQDDVSVPAATNVAYSFVTLSGTHLYSCTVSNSYAAVPSGNVTLIGAMAAPTNLYPQTVLSNNPIAYWRLGETNDGLNDGNPGVIAYDYVGGHNAVYTNVNLGLTGYNPVMDPDTAAQFGVFASSNSYAGEIDQSSQPSNTLANINFATPAGGNASLSIEAWINSTNATQISGAGIVTKGYGDGGEQFDLDLYGNALRFFVRDASGGVHGPTSTFVPTVGQWCHVVGVWDGPNGASHLYVNGVDNIDVTGIATGLGLLATGTTNIALPGAALVSIGARTSSQATNYYDLQFQGKIDDVAIYNYALSSNMVAADYQAGIFLPQETLGVTNLGGGQLQLNWGFGTLQNATNVSGPYVNVTNATPPYTISTTNARQFYRIMER